MLIEKVSEEEIKNALIELGAKGIELQAAGTSYTDNDDEQWYLTYLDAAPSHDICDIHIHIYPGPNWESEMDIEDLIENFDLVHSVTLGYIEGTTYSHQKEWERK